MNWIFNDPAELNFFFEMALPVFLPSGLTYLDPHDRGAAAWLGPNQRLNWPYRLPEILRVVRAGGLSSLLKLALGGIKMEKFHPSEPHYYLFAIGVLPANKGQGLGTALISQMLRRCDQEQMPAYLENSKEENLPFYEGHGFRVTGEVKFSRSAPPLWLMWREPQVNHR